MDQRLYIVAYDIADPKRWRRICKLMKGYGMKAPARCGPANRTARKTTLNPRHAGAHRKRLSPANSPGPHRSTLTMSPTSNQPGAFSAPRTLGILGGKTSRVSPRHNGAWFSRFALALSEPNYFSFLRVKPLRKDQAQILHRPDGAVLSYRITGPTQPGEGPALILLHGLASNQTRWSEFVENTTLTQTHPVVRVDLRGHGGSVTRRRIGLDLWCDDLLALLDETGCEAALVIGHSLGAQVALHFAARFPRRVLGICLIDPLFPTALHSRWRLLRLGRPLLAAGAAAVRGLNALGLHRHHLPTRDLRALDRLARAALRSKADEEAFVRHYSSARADLRHVPLAVYLQDLAEMFQSPPLPQTLGVPVLVLLSTAGTFADPRQTNALLRDSPNVQVHMIDCHHWPLTERPDEIRRTIEAWCLEI